MRRVGWVSILVAAVAYAVAMLYIAVAATAAAFAQREADILLVAWLMSSLVTAAGASWLANRARQRLRR